jgi:transposase
MAAVDPADLVFLDESGVTTSMTRLYGRAPKGQRVPDTVPHGRWKVLTILGALSAQGVTAAMTVEAATDGEVFRCYIEQVLAPQLRPGQVVILDNLSAHFVPGIQELIEARHCRLRYLPPYSPDLNPIEQAWSKLKTQLRAAKARTREALEQAVAEGLQAISAQDARAFFGHCGYPLQ